MKKAKYPTPAVILAKKMIESTNVVTSGIYKEFIAKKLNCSTKFIEYMFIGKNKKICQPNIRVVNGFYIFS